MIVFASISHTHPKGLVKSVATSDFFPGINQKLSGTLCCFLSRKQSCTEAPQCPRPAATAGLTNPWGTPSPGTPCPPCWGPTGFVIRGRNQTHQLSAALCPHCFGGHKHTTNVCENFRKLIKAPPEFQSHSVTSTLLLDSLLDFILPKI